MRGKVSGGLSVGLVVWDHPRICGEKIPFLPVPLSEWDHPRACGEKPEIERTVILTLGSPPRMRGKGNQCSGFSGLQGSPPRMRGKVDFCRQLFTGDRITPAYAGKSGCSGSCTAGRRDHPRVCGEKSGCEAGKRPRKGSPPRMRGKVDTLQTVHDAIGITPAYAGKSALQSCKKEPFWDHPRICGEKTKKNGIG